MRALNILLLVAYKDQLSGVYVEFFSDPFKSDTQRFPEPNVIGRVRQIDKLYQITKISQRIFIIHSVWDIWQRRGQDVFRF